MFAGESFIDNGSLCSRNKMDSIQVIHAGTVYEVLRVIDEVPVFWQDHYQRLQSSWAACSHLPLPSFSQLSISLAKLIKANGIICGNIRIDCDPSTGMWFVCQVVANYPSDVLYQKGIHVGLMNWERETPNLKITKPRLGEAHQRQQREENVYESLLVNAQGFMTEGSRSNLFFVSDKTVVTAPLNCVLAGITRKYVIQACRHVGLECNERLVHVDEISQFGAAFITGTSPKVLPIAFIDSYVLDASYPQILKIRAAYDMILQQEIRGQQAFYNRIS